MGLAWSSLFLGLLAVAIAPPDPDIMFNTPADFRGSWSVDGPEAGYLIGEESLEMEGTASQLRVVSTDVHWLRADNPVVQAGESAAGPANEQVLHDAVLELQGCQVWGLAFHEVSWHASLDGRVTIPATVAAGEQWDNLGSLGARPHPLVRTLPAARHDSAVVALEGSGNVEIVGDATMEIYGFCGVIHHRSGVETIESGRIEQVMSPYGDQWSLHRYIRIEATDMRLLMQGDMRGMLVSPSSNLAGNGTATIPYLHAMQPLLERGHTLPNGTWQAIGDLQLTNLRPSPGDGIVGNYAGSLAGLQVDGRTAIIVEKGTIAGGVTILGVVLAFLVKTAYATALFTRLSPQEALEHPRRQTLHKYIQDNPGATFRELCRATDIPAGTCRHHLSVLDRAQVIVEHRHRSTVRFFENHGKFDRNWQEMVMLREPELAQIHSWIKDNEGAIQKDILEHALSWGWSRSTTQHRLQRLVDNGLLDVQEMGRRKSYSLANSEPEPVRQFGLRV